MRKTAPVLVSLVCILIPAVAAAADAADVVEKVLELQEERREGVDRYVVEQKVMGQITTIVFERTTVTGPDGDPIETFRVVLPDTATPSDEEAAFTREDFDNMAEESVHTIADFADTATLVGTESVDGTDAYHLVASNLNRVRDFGDGGTFTLQTVNAWIDTSKYVPLRITMDGDLDADGNARPMTMDVISQDYRDVPGSNLYESYRQIMRMNGVMTDETRAQVEQARVQLEEFEQQLLEMPQSQRDMMMNMMGDQIEMMRKLAAGEGLEIITEVVSITVE
jgi:hypothetical protein